MPQTAEATFDPHLSTAEPDASPQGVDAGSDGDFGRICASICTLATGLFDAPLAVLKLYEDNKLVIRGTAGFDDLTGLDGLAFSQRKLIPGEPLIIPDATADARYFLETAVLKAPKLRFYADYPLVSDGVILGVLSLCERLPRHDFTGQKLNLFRQFANQAATMIALAHGARQRDAILDDLKSLQVRFDVAQELTGIGYWAIDLKTRNIVWSKGLYAIYGLAKSYKPRVGTQLEIYEPQDTALIIDKFQRAVNYGEDFDFNVEIVRRKDKMPRLIRTRGGVEYDDHGVPVRLCAVVHDITSADVAKGAESPAHHEASEMNDAKDAFLAQIAYELKTPLNNILGFAKLINDRSADGADIASYTSGLMKSAKALQFLIKDTLDVSALDAPAPRDQAQTHSSEEAVHVVNLIKDVVSQFTMTAQAHQTRINAHFIDIDNAWAQLDQMRLRQVVQNLLGNACKFTRNGLINVTASQVSVDNSPWLRISVRDTGIGMTEEQAFGLFSDQTNDMGQMNRKSGGPGIGLSISRAIVDLLGGHIGVVSRQGEGSNFWFEIPVQWTGSVGVANPAPLEEPKVEAPKVEAEPPVRKPHRAPVDALRPQRPAPVFAPIEMAKPVTAPRVDDDRINREYLRALLQDMKLDIQ